MKAFSIYAALCLCCLFLPVPPESAGFYTGAPFYTNFTYMFFHAGAFHLILNAAALFFLFRSGKYGFRALIA
ncbi:MAG: rhomboid family intramembrane serine protease, partial [Bacteroidales bacterium]|nr:rhomboid family intramembrane serine protease [Bacteroidales bacterium]